MSRPSPRDLADSRSAAVTLVAGSRSLKGEGESAPRSALRSLVPRVWSGPPSAAPAWRRKPAAAAWRKLGQHDVPAGRVSQPAPMRRRAPGTGRPRTAGAVSCRGVRRCTARRCCPAPAQSAGAAPCRRATRSRGPAEAFEGCAAQRAATGWGDGPSTVRELTAGAGGGPSVRGSTDRSRHEPAGGWPHVGELARVTTGPGRRKW